MRRLFDRLLAGRPEQAADRQAQIRLATAVLLVEMMRADFDERQEESEAVEKLLARHFDLDAPQSETLAEDAAKEADNSVSLHDYTRALHEQLNEQEKARVVEMLWEVALADDSLDKYEDYLVRKVAELLYVPHGELIRLKHKVQARLEI